MNAKDWHAAYLNAEYVVHADDGAAVLRIGESTTAAALLRQLGARQAAFVTAANPGSQQLAAAENHRRHAQLLQQVRADGYTTLPGEGRDPAGVWPAEASLLIVGIPRDAANALATRFGQNAWVWLTVQNGAELIWTADGK